MAKPTRIIGIDFGLQRIGLAISDETKTIAFALATIPTAPKMEGTIDNILKQLNTDQTTKKYTIEQIVVGMPLLMSGQSGFMADEVKHFIQLLKEKSQLPVNTWDERLTSVQADRSLREGNLTRKQRSKAVDRVAAVIILQNYLDHKKLQLDGENMLTS